LSHVVDLEGPERPFRLSSDEIDLLNPNTHTVPVFRSRRDAVITLDIYRRVQVLIRHKDPEGNPWGTRWLLMFMMNMDSGLFRTREELETDGFRLDGNVFRKCPVTYLRLYEGQMVDFFDHRADDVVLSADCGGPTTSAALPHDGGVSSGHPAGIPTVLGGQNTTSPTNERTFVVSTIPRSAVSNKLRLLLGNQKPT